MGGRTWWRMLVLAAALGATGCAKSGVVRGPRLEADTLLEMVRHRPVPDPTQARFSIKIRFAKQGINPPRLGGGLVVDRPSKAYLAVLDPVGSPVITVSSDGDRVVLMNNRDKQFVAQDDAEAALVAFTEGAVSLADLVDMLLGLLPLDQADVTSKQTTDAGVKFSFDAPGGIVIGAWVDDTNGTPRRIEVDNAEGQRVVNAVYEPFELVDGVLMPTEISIDGPIAEITMNLKYKTWKVLEAAPDVFTPTAPDNYAVLSFDDFVAGMGDAMGVDSAPTPETGAE